MKTFEDLDITGVKLNDRGNQKVLCPKCSSTRKNKHDKCLSVNVVEGIGHCHNCGWSFALHKKEFIRDYIKPKPPVKVEVGEKITKWFQDRGISKETIRDFRIFEEKQWMPQVKNVAAGERNCMCFPYFRGDELVNVKYRDGAKTFRMVKDAELIFYNLNAIKGFKECVIVEGELDAMAMHEASITQVVSVPNGASKNAKMEYLNNCIDEFGDKTKITIAVDGDDAGIALKTELIRRLGSERCATITYPEGCKDANEVLLKYGHKVLLDMVNSAQMCPLDGVYVIDSSNEIINEIYANGYPTALSIGYDGLDKLIKWKLGDFTVITGIPNSGKSQWLDQIMIRLATRHRWKFGIFSPENQPVELHVIKLAEIFTGQPFYRYDGLPRMNPLTKDVTLASLGESFFFMKVEEIDTTIDGLLDKAREMVARYGINAFVFDPYNCIEHQVPRGYTETQYISEILEKIRRFKLKTNCHFFLVAHPKKMQKRPDGQFEVPDLYDIAGSSHFFNKADNGITVYRNQDDTVDVHIQKIRHKWVGQKGSQKFLYDKLSGRYCEDGKAFVSEIDWEKAQSRNGKLQWNDGENDCPF